MIFLSLLLFVPFSHQLNNGLGLTPQMGQGHILCFFCTFSAIAGWNSWNHFHCNIDETIIRRGVDAIVATGLAAAGYQYGLSFFVEQS